MKTIVMIFVMVALMATSVWATSNLNLSKSNVNRLSQRGTMVTNSVDMNGSVSRNVYSIPDNAEFLLTQVCVGQDIDNGLMLIELDGAKIVQLPPNTCQTFSPGVFMDGGQVLECTTTSPRAKSFCMISGLQVLLPTPTTIP